MTAEGGAPASTGRSLSERIAEIVRQEGPIRFERFQGLALYDPDGGYYERAGRVGRDGDFVTGASWHPAFARCIARVARALAAELGPALDIVDVGAGEGELLGHLSDAFSPEELVRLRGVEASSVRRRLGAARVPRAVIEKSISDLPPVRGVVIAYELFDALPVRVLRLSEGGELLERRVALAGEGFRFVEAPCADGDAIRADLADRGVELRPGQIFEIRPGAAAMAREIAGRLEAGLLLVFDYGAPARALYGPARPGGTLEAYAGHRVSRDVLIEPGTRDITAWVDFTEVERELAACGFTIRGLVSQSRFLSAAGIAGELALDDPETPPSAARAAERNAIAKLFAPGGMGESIRVLVAERGTSFGDTLVRFPDPRNPSGV